MSLNQSRIDWIASLKSGGKVIVQSNFKHAEAEEVQAISKSAVYAGGVAYHIQGDQLLWRDGYKQAWLIPATGELLELIRHGKRVWRKQDWDGFQKRLDNLPGNYVPEDYPREEWGVLYDTNRFNEACLTEPLFWKEPKLVFFRGLNETETDLFASTVTCEQIDAIFAIMALCPHHQFRVITKHRGRMEAYLDNTDGYGDTEERIGIAAGKLLDGTWIWEKGAPFRKRIEDLISLSHGFKPGSEETEQAETELLPLDNVVFGFAKKAKVAHV